MNPIMMLLMLSILTSFSSASVVDFCVADLNYPVGPAGYPCKNPANLTVDDFVFSGLGVAGNTSTNIFKLASNRAIVHTFPGLNGLGISLARQDIGVGGVNPLHVHPSTELILLIEGTIISGFIASDNRAYYKTLNKGDIMVLPPSLLHFQVNVGEIPSVALVTFNSANPGVEFVPKSLGGNDLPTEIIEKITLLDTQEVNKLKSIFHGNKHAV